jgi:FMN phosphatase YigB (HAD superfamily)
LRGAPRARFRRGGKPLGLAVCWINRRGIDLHPSVPPPDHILPDIRSLLPLLGI